VSAMVVGSAYSGDLFSTPAMRSVFSDERRFESWLRVEVALAKAQAQVGVIPAEAAIRIGEVARLEMLDVVAMKAEYDRVGFPIVPLVKQLVRLCDPESARWVHWGATTQDIVDTGMVLQMRDAFNLLQWDLDGVVAALRQLTIDHRDTVMVGRTFQQHAAPITFGFKAAVWLDELLNHRDRYLALKRRALVCQLGGAVGNLATLGADGVAVRRAFSAELGLAEPAITWHTARDAWAEVVFWLALVGSTLGKIATEVATLMRSEVDEVREPFVLGRGGSSTMPQKRNPILCPPMIAIGHRLRDMVASQLAAMVQEHERAVGAMPIEWMVVPDAFLLTSGTLSHGKALLQGLEVDVERMRVNLESGSGSLMAESVMMGLAQHVGKTEAHERVYAAARLAVEHGSALRTELLADPGIADVLGAPEIDRLLDPHTYLGDSGEMIDRVLERAEVAS
jgi:3-carboxy-cis,cis-muconate cycloisomerase